MKIEPTLDRSAHPSVADASPLHPVIADALQRPAKVDGIAIGQFARLNADGVAHVSIPGWAVLDVPARTLIPLDTTPMGQALALGFEGGDPLRPVVLARLANPHHAAPKLELVVDGERVVVRADRELELCCGDAAIVLSRDGSIQLRGHPTSRTQASPRVVSDAVNMN